MKKNPTGSLRLREIVNHAGAMARELKNEYQTRKTARGVVLCDVGCDHALVPVTLLLDGAIDSAIAVDVKKEPLERAKRNAAAYGVSERMRFVQADGLTKLQAGEAELCVIAGMGGELITDILRRGSPQTLGVRYLLLSPHTKWADLRRFLRTEGYGVFRETYVEEDEKIYPLLSCRVPEKTADADAERTEDESLTEIMKLFPADRQQDALRICDRYGSYALCHRDEVLDRYLAKRLQELDSILERMPAAGHDAQRDGIVLEQEDASVARSLPERVRLS